MGKVRCSATPETIPQHHGVWGSTDQFFGLRKLLWEWQPQRTIFGFCDEGKLAILANDSGDLQPLSSKRLGKVHHSTAKIMHTSALVSECIHGPGLPSGCSWMAAGCHTE